MILFDFDYERASTLEEAVLLLARPGGDARLLAGGTDLLPNIRMGNVSGGLLVSLGGIAPEEPKVLPDGSIRVDALSRLSTLENSDLLKTRVPMLAESAYVVGSNQVRQMGTLGGNLCQETRCLYLDQKHDFQYVAPCFKRGGDCCYPFPGNDRDTCWAVHMSDVAPALIALDAAIEILGPDGTRRIGAEALFSGSGLMPITLDHAEIVRAAIIPPSPPRSGWGYHKSTVRGGLEYGMAIIATALRLEADGRTCAAARIVVGAIREKPVRAAAAERLLAGAVLDEALLAGTAAEASREISPLPHHGFTKRYLRDNIRVYLRRALGSALERARGLA